MVGYIAFLLATLVLIKIIIELSLPGFYVLLLLAIWGVISSYGLYIFYRAEPVLGVFNMLRTEKFNSYIFKYLWLSEFITFLARLSFNIMFGFLSFFLYPGGYRYKFIIYISSLVLLLIVSVMYQIALAKFYVIRNNDNSVDINLSVLLLIFSGVIGWFITSIVNGLIKITREIESQGYVSSQMITPLIPGLTLPLFESIIALGFVMIVHELAHAIIAINKNINIKSTGLVTYGGLPVGAFVEPDELEFQNMKNKQDKLDILLAGVGVNLFFSLIFFLAFWMFSIISAPYSIVGACISDDIIEGKTVIIKKIDGVPCINAFFRNDSLLETNFGNFVMNRYVKYAPLPNNPIYKIYDNELFKFINNILFMLFALNLIVAITNIFPVYFLDGGQVIQTVFQKQGAKILALTTGALLILILISVILK